VIDHGIIELTYLSVGFMGPFWTLNGSSGKLSSCEYDSWVCLLRVGYCRMCGDTLRNHVTVGNAMSPASNLSFCDILKLHRFDLLWISCRPRTPELVWVTRSIWKMLGPFAKASRLTPIHQMTLAVLSRAACASMSTTTTTIRRRQRVTEGTAMAPWNGPNN